MCIFYIFVPYRKIMEMCAACQSIENSLGRWLEQKYAAVEEEPTNTKDLYYVKEKLPSHKQYNRIHKQCHLKISRRKIDDLNGKNCVSYVSQNKVSYCYS